MRVNFLIAIVLLIASQNVKAAKEMIADGKISASEAVVLAEATNLQSGIPVVIDANVLKQLNKTVGTKSSRKGLRATLKRMQTFESMIEEKLKKAGLPEELMAIPIIESGYQNNSDGVAAGLWAFIPGTARRFGLTVNKKTDERFDIDLATDAAVQYFAKLHHQFKDWPLVFLAYNAGERRVQQAIARTGIRDAYRLVRENHLKGQQHYLPKTMAAIIVLRNPNLIQD